MQKHSGLSLSADIRLKVDEDHSQTLYQFNVIMPIWFSRLPLLVNFIIVWVFFYHSQASYFIFEKMKLEGFAGSDGEVRLRTTITIPRSAAGRVIGKGGKNVREIQRITGAMIKLPADVSHETASQPQQQQQQQDPQQGDEEVTVEVFGNFIATQVSNPNSESCGS